MPIAVVAASATANYSLTSPITGTLPAGTASGHMLLAYACARNSSSIVSLPSASPGAWTLVSLDDGGAGAVAAVSEVSAKVAGGSETNPTAAMTGLGSQPGGLVLVAVSGSDQTVANITSVENEGASATMQALDIAAADGDLVLRFYFQADDNTVVTPPSGHTALFNETSLLGSDAAILIYWKIQSGGTGLAGAASVVMNGSDPYTAYSVVVKQAVAATGLPPVHQGRYGE